MDPEPHVTPRDTGVVYRKIAHGSPADDRIAGPERMAERLAIPRISEDEHRRLRG
jgi:hypothetical protein